MAKKKTATKAKTNKTDSSSIKADKAETETNEKRIDLSELSLTDLIGLQNALPAIIEQAKKTEKAALRKHMEALAAASGFEISEVFDDEPKQKKRRQIGFVKAKYMNPDNDEQTWTGRGRKPKWAQDHLKNGGKLTDLLINPD